MQTGTQTQQIFFNSSDRPCCSRDLIQNIAPLPVENINLETFIDNSNRNLGDNITLNLPTNDLQGISIENQNPHFLLNFPSNFINFFGRRRIFWFLIISTFLLSFYFLIRIGLSKSITDFKIFKILGVTLIALTFFNLFILCSSAGANPESELGKLVAKDKWIFLNIVLLNLILFSFTIAELIVRSEQIDQEFLMIAISVIFFLILGLLISMKIPRSFCQSLLVILWGFGIILLFDFKKLERTIEN